jgi:AraC-like DNA-binding protein
MDLVFSTDQFEPAKRYAAWRDAICDVYVHVDVAATDPDDYKGFIRETHFGEIVMTDILVSEQRITRRAHHISSLDKDCYYLQLIHHGNANILQKGAVHSTNPARAGIFCATEEYELHCIGDVRSYYLELPREAFAQRFPREKVPLSAVINSTQGLGRIATEFCGMLATEGTRLDTDVRSGLGNQLMDILALTLLSADDQGAAAEGAVQKARLRSVQNWIEQHLGEHDLSLERIAFANNISLRYLHTLFRHCEMSASEWLWHRRLQHCYDLIARGDSRSITAIAFDLGFSSSAHFSTMFRRKYGLRPRDLR